MKKLVIVGAGITGLSAGINALNKGYKVVIYEKNKFAGGCATGWYKEGYYIDNCMHWLTGTNQFTKDFKMWKKVGGLSETTNLYQSSYFYKSIKDNEEIALYSDTEKVRLEMLNLSNVDNYEINNFIDAVNKMIIINQDHNLINNFFNKMINYPSVYLKYHKLSLEDLSNKFKHPLLKQLFIDYLPKEYSALALIFAYATYASGNGKICTKGTTNFVNNILQTYKTLGGEIYYESEVTSINIIDKKVKNIIINHSEIIPCSYLIYTGDPNHLFTNIIDKSYLPIELKNKYQDKSKYPIHSSFHSAYLIDKATNPIKDTIIFDIPLIKVGSTTINRLFIKEYSYLYDNKPKTIIQSFIIQNMNDYEYWKDLKEKSVDEYNKRKKEIGEQIKDILISRYPVLKESIKLIDTWTPLTYNEYYHAYYGSYMGFTLTNKCNCYKITNKIKNINNLYLATYWQRLCGGLPVALKHGNEVTKYI